MHALGKVAKRLVVRIGPAQLIFILTDKETKANDVTGWCEFSVNELFLEYVMEGLTPEDNEIYLDVSAESLSGVLNGVRMAPYNVKGLKLKLTRKFVPCLTVEIETKTLHASSVCTHDIPITVLPKVQWAEYEKPQFPVFNASMALPELKIVRSTIDRLHNICPTKLSIVVLPGAVGDIVFYSASPTSNMRVAYLDLRVFQIDGVEPEDVVINQEEGEEGEKSFKVEIDIKHMVRVLPSEHLKPSSSVFSIIDGKMIHLFYIFDDATLQYCLPDVKFSNIDIRCRRL